MSGAGAYQAILVSEEEAAQVDRLRYTLSHGVKEGLVAHAGDWPGVHSVRELLAGEPIRGLWFDRTKEYAARNRGENFDRLKYATEQTFELTPLPCWAHLSPDAYRERVAALVTEIEAKPRRRSPRAVMSLWEWRPSCASILTPVRAGRRSLRLLFTTRRRKPCARPSGRPMPCSYPHFARRPTVGERVIERQGFRWARFLRGYPS
jgi:hypothetical protein